jgi:hypothetical protein
MDTKNPIRIHDAAGRLKSHAPHAKLLLGVWSANDGMALSGLKDAINADYAVRNFSQALPVPLVLKNGIAI